MGPFAFLDHLLNFVAPAAFVALILALAGGWVTGRRKAGPGRVKAALVLFGAGCVVLLAGLWWFGRDGKMATYAALVVVLALVHWAMLGGWRR